MLLLSNAATAKDEERGSFWIALLPRGEAEDEGGGGGALRVVDETEVVAVIVTVSAFVITNRLKVRLFRN